VTEDSKDWLTGPFIGREVASQARKRVEDHVTIWEAGEEHTWTSIEQTTRIRMNTVREGKVRANSYGRNLLRACLKKQRIIVETKAGIGVVVIHAGNALKIVERPKNAALREHSKVLALGTEALKVKGLSAPDTESIKKSVYFAGAILTAAHTDSGGGILEMQPQKELIPAVNQKR